MSPLPTPHLDKLQKTIENEKTPDEDRERLHAAKQRYRDWVAALDAVAGSPEERLRRLVELYNQYRTYVDLDLIFDSPRDFLYRQKGQLKLDNSVLEEFLPRLATPQVIPELAGLTLLVGPQTCFSAAYFASSLDSPQPGGGLTLRGKDQDFALAMPLHIRASHTPDFANVAERSTAIAYMAAECKTNLDKTMFQEACATARDVKAAVTGARYFVRISPDGRRVAYVVSAASFEKNAYVPVLYVVDANGGTPLRLTYATAIANRPLPRPMLRWSPDGTALSFVALIDGVPQVVAMDARGGEPRPLTSGKDGVVNYAWAPDGKRLAYVAPDPPPAPANTNVIRVDRDERPTRLWVQDVAAGTVAKSLTPPAQFVHGIDWTPDGAHIIYSASSRTGFLAPYYTRLYRIASAGGEPQPLVDRPGMNTSPRCSPDGKWVAFVSTDRQTGVMATRGLYLVPSAGGEIRYLTRTLEAWVEDFVWMPDSKSILLLPHEGTFSHAEHMFEQHIVRVRLEDGRAETLTEGATVEYSLSISTDGSRLAYRSVAAETMGDVFVMETATRRATRVTEVNPELGDLDLGSLRPIRWQSFDGMEIWGLLLTPPRYAPGTRLPLIVYCHGGPIGGFTYGIFPQFAHTVGQVDPYPVQALASAGMAILFPMPRGGSGYGVQNFHAIVNAWGEGDYRDIMAGVDYVIKEGIADPERLGVMGASYGGFMTSWIVTQTHRFKAASTDASVNDLADAYYLGDAGDFMIEYFGFPWEARAAYAAHSPLTFAANVTTPLLIQHGENDRRVPLAQAQKFYRALKAHNATVEFDIYPRGGHVLYEPALQREQMQRNLEWFTRWLKPATSP